MPDLPRGEVFKWIRTKRVTVNGARAKGEQRLRVGDVVAIRGAITRFPRADVAPPIAGAREDRSVGGGKVPPHLEVLYEDDALLAVNKPAGLLMHPGGGHLKGDATRHPEPTLAEAIRAYLGRSSPTFTPGPAHRLDRNTSGVVLVGKTLGAARALASAFAEHRVHKLYWALLWGRLEPSLGEVVAPLTRQEEISRVAEQGSSARTAVEVVASRGDTTLVRLSPTTGRTHQLRVHMAHLGAPICGDRKYGAAPTLGLGRPFLHAGVVRLRHPVHEELLEIAAPLPEELRALLRKLGYPPPLADVPWVR